jgi:tetratricopeptide (TPR) repeat protein
MNGCYFISYSRVDGEEFAQRIADELVAGPPSYGVWLDVRDEQPGADWDIQIRDAIHSCQGVLFLMTEDSVQDYSGCKAEWALALRCKKPVIPLRVDAGAGLPFRLSSREYIDFSGGFNVGLARLRKYLGGVGSPEWVLQDLRDQLREAERELPRADPAQRPRVVSDLRELREKVAVQEQLLADPKAARRRTEQRIAAGLEQERQPERPAVTPARAKFVNQPPMVAPSYFQDRHVESEQVGNFLRADDERIMTVVGRGGVGKTAMVCRLLRALEAGHLPDDLGDLAVDGIVYLSPFGAHPVNFPNLFADLCRLLPADSADQLRQQYRDPHQTPAVLMRSLLDAFPSGRVVVLLDNAEDVIGTDSGDFVITDAALDEALQALLSAPAHGVKVMLTTRVAPRGLLLTHPERQRRLDLDEGLGSPYAEQVLRARDPDGRLGLKTAPDQLLDRARERTRGYPRALEALAAILAADRDTTLPELLTQTAQLPGNVVEVLVGEAFSRLDASAQQVMQALAIYTVPVPPVAVDYLLQPYRPAVDAAPLLGRLANMQFVRREAGRYYLHQVDRDYALSRLPAGEPADRDADPAPFTQQALWHRGADYFEQTRTPREDWKTLDDLAPQLAEFELRCQGADYDTAAQVLFAIGFDYLIQWGHYRLTAEKHQRLQGHLEDPWTNATSKSQLGECYRLLGEFVWAVDLQEQALAIARETGDRSGEAAHLGNLGNCYYEVGQITRAIELHEQALAIARETGDRSGEATHLGNLGNCHGDLGQIARAIDLYEQALAIAHEIGDRDGEAIHLGNLGNCYYELGQIAQAIESYEQALAITRETGYRLGEATNLGNLGNCHSDLGQIARAIDLYEQALAINRETGYRRGEGMDLCRLGNRQLELGQIARAIDLYEQALAIAREIGDRYDEALDLANLGEAHGDLGSWDQGAEYCRQAIEVADVTGNAQARSAANLILAQIQLLAGDLSGAQQTVSAARARDYPPNRAKLSLLSGIAQLRQDRRTPAAQEFGDALTQADELLEQTSGSYGALDTKALALCGLALTTDPGKAAEASTVFCAARAISSADNVVRRILALFDALAAADQGGILAGIRQAVEAADLSNDHRAGPGPG